MEYLMRNFQPYSGPDPANLCNADPFIHGKIFQKKVSPGATIVSVSGLEKTLGMPGIILVKSSSQNSCKKIYYSSDPAPTLTFIAEYNHKHK
jgi:hypothetical protein